MDYLPEELDQTEAIALAQARAKALRAQAAQTPQGQTTGNAQFQHYVAPSWSQQLRPILNGVLASRQEDKIVDMQRRQREAQIEDLERLRSTIPADKEIPGPELPGPTQNEQPLMGSTLQKATAADRAKWGVQAMKNPLAKKIGESVVQDALNKDPDNEADRLIKALQAAYGLAGKQATAQATVTSSENRANAVTTSARLALLGRIYGADKSAESRNYASDNSLASAKYKADKTLEGIQLKLKAAGGPKLSDKALNEIQSTLTGISRQDVFEQNFDANLMVGVAGKLNQKFGGKWWAEKLNLTDPDSQKAYEWWRDFKANDNVERHELFGAAITKDEEKAWLATTVGPWDTEDTIRNAIHRRKEILQGVLDRKTKMASMSPQQQIEYARSIGLQGYDTGEPGVANPYTGGAAAPTAAPAGPATVGSTRETAIPFQEGVDYPSGTWVTKDGKYKKVP